MKKQHSKSAKFTKGAKHSFPKKTGGAKKNHMDLGFAEPMFPAKVKGKGTGKAKKNKMGFKAAY